MGTAVGGPRGLERERPGEGAAGKLTHRRQRLQSVSHSRSGQCWGCPSTSCHEHDAIPGRETEGPCEARTAETALTPFYHRPHPAQGSTSVVYDGHKADNAKQGCTVSDLRTADSRVGGMRKAQLILTTAPYGEAGTAQQPYHLQNCGQAGGSGVQEQTAEQIKMTKARLWLSDRQQRQSSEVVLRKLTASRGPEDKTSRASNMPARVACHPPCLSSRSHFHYANCPPKMEGRMHQG